MSKAIDAPASEPPEALAVGILKELAAATIDYEVSYADGIRRLQAALPRPAEVERYAGIRPGSVWVVSGGARGITAQCVLELGHRFRLKLHLLGTSPSPEIDPAWRDLSEEGLKQLKSNIIRQARQAGTSPPQAWQQVQKAIEIGRTLAALAADGIEATYHSCDVSQREALAEVLERIRAKDGPIEGILHGAGIDRSCRFESKQSPVVQAALGAKLDGAYHLMTLTWQDPIRVFLGFGSIAGRLGSNGQADYCLASDALAKLISWYRTRRPSCRAIGFHWHPWDEVGMAALPEAKAVLERAGGPRLMPKAEGLRTLVRELYTRGEESEVLVTDWDYYRRYYMPEAKPDAAGQVGGAESAQPMDRSDPTEMTGPAKRGKDQIAQRHVMRMVDAPLEEGEAQLPREFGPVYLLGENETARAIERRLAALGVAAYYLPSGDDPDAALAELDRLWSASPARHLILLTGRDPDAGELLEAHSTARRLARGVYLPFLVTQRWLERVRSENSSQPPSLMAATALGGDFGFSGRVRAPEGGALTGLLKSLHVEESRRPSQQRLRICAIDSPSEQPADVVAEAMLRELAAGCPDIEVGWHGGRRRVVGCVAQPVAELPRRPFPCGGTWIVTGGARGITAESALELARKYNLKLHLVGKVPRPSPVRRGATHQPKS